MKYSGMRQASPDVIIANDRTVSKESVLKLE
jgi:hypothetical protein